MNRLIIALLVALTTPAVFAQNPSSSKGPLITSPIGVGDFLQMLIGLIIVLGIIFAMAWLIRRMGHVPVRMQGALKVLCGISVGQRERIMLIQVGEQQLLVGIAPGQIRTLHVLAHPVGLHDAAAPASAQSFAEKLQAIMKGRQP
jgi:flagellar protein FliO/FliZ